MIGENIFADKLELVLKDDHEENDFVKNEFERDDFDVDEFKVNGFKNSPNELQIDSASDCHKLGRFKLY